MQKALFVSDIHIRSADDPKHELFCEFLDACLAKPPAHLFLVGDIFDLWIADRRYFVKRFPAVIQKIQRLKATTQVHYFEGNHDLDLKLFWQHKLGVDVRDQAAYYTIDGKTLRVEHGDQMDPEDKGYLFLRWLLRTPVMRALGRNLPDGLVRLIGERASRASRDYTSNVKTTSEDRSIEKTRDHARRAFAEKPFDLFVSGHLHVIEDSWQEVGGKRFRCFNLGTWLKTPFVLEVEGERIGLKRVDDFLRG